MHFMVYVIIGASQYEYSVSNTNNDINHEIPQEMPTQSLLGEVDIDTEEHEAPGAALLSAHQCVHPAWSHQTLSHKAHGQYKPSLEHQTFPL